MDLERHLLHILSLEIKSIIPKMSRHSCKHMMATDDMLMNDVSNVYCYVSTDARHIFTVVGVAIL